MKVATVKMKSLSPYSQSRKLPPKPDKETHEDFEKRIWRERIHVNDAGNVFIPPMAFKFSLQKAAQYLRIRIPGKGQSEYGKHFLSGILVLDGPDLGVAKENIEGEWLSLHANGKRGSGSRVDRCMPVVRTWEATVVYYVLDETITKEIFEKVLAEAGSFIGLGRFRPENGGFYGRYQIESVTWSEE